MGVWSSATFFAVAVWEPAEALRIRKMLNFRKRPVRGREDHQDHVRLGFTRVDHPHRFDCRDVEGLLLAGVQQPDVPRGRVVPEGWHAHEGFARQRRLRRLRRLALHLGEERQLEEPEGFHGASRSSATAGRTTTCWPATGRAPTPPTASSLPRSCTRPWSLRASHEGLPGMPGRM